MSSWNPVADCVNITQRICHLSPNDIPMDELELHNQVRVFAGLNADIRYDKHGVTPATDSKPSFI